jgi:holin-like protein
MALLAGWLSFDPRAADRLRGTSLELLRHLSLLFVPAGVGVMLHAARLADEALAIGVALMASTALAIVVTALVVQWSARWLAPAAAGGETPPTMGTASVADSGGSAGHAVAPGTTAAGTATATDVAAAADTLRDIAACDPIRSATPPANPPAP